MVSLPNSKPSRPPLGPWARKHSFPCHQCSHVRASLTVFTRELPSTVVSVPTAVWSRSVSSCVVCAEFLPTGTVNHCGAHSRSQRTAHVLFLLIWWSTRINVFQSVRSSAIAKFSDGRDAKVRVRFGLSTCRSRLTKKCALFLTIGPPSTPPQSRRTEVGFSRFCVRTK